MGKILDWFNAYYVDCEFLMQLLNTPRGILALILLVAANIKLWDVSLKKTVIVTGVLLVVYLIAAYIIGKTKLREKIDRERGKKSGVWIDINKRLDKLEEEKC